MWRWITCEIDWWMHQFDSSCSLRRKHTSIAWISVHSILCRLICCLVAIVSIHISCIMRWLRWWHRLPNTVISIRISAILTGMIVSMDRWTMMCARLWLLRRLRWLRMMIMRSCWRIIETVLVTRWRRLLEKAKKYFNFGLQCLQDLCVNKPHFPIGHSDSSYFHWGHCLASVADNFLVLAVVPVWMVRFRFVDCAGSSAIVHNRLVTLSYCDWMNYEAKHT